VTVAAPVRPPEMKGEDEAAAMAAAAYFTELFSYVVRTGDLDEWTQISGQTCKFCENTATHIDALYSGGGRVTGRTVDITSERVVGVDEQLIVYSVLVSYDLAPGAEVDSSGVSPRPLTQETGQIIMDVAPSVRGWILMGGDSQ
jgi:hypothetical protein